MTTCCCYVVAGSLLFVLLAASRVSTYQIRLTSFNNNNQPATNGPWMVESFIFLFFAGRKFYKMSEENLILFYFSLLSLWLFPIVSSFDSWLPSGKWAATNSRSRVRERGINQRREKKSVWGLRQNSLAVSANSSSFLPFASRRSAHLLANNTR